MTPLPAHHKDMHEMHDPNDREPHKETKREPGILVDVSGELMRLRYIKDDWCHLVDTEGIFWASRTMYVIADPTESPLLARALGIKGD